MSIHNTEKIDQKDLKDPLIDNNSSNTILKDASEIKTENEAQIEPPNDLIGEIKPENYSGGLLPLHHLEIKMEEIDKKEDIKNLENSMSNPVWEFREE